MERKVPTRQDIIDSINTAIAENYYEDMEVWSDEDHATELWLYHPDIDCNPNDAELLEHVRAWRAQWPEYKANLTKNALADNFGRDP